MTKRLMRAWLQMSYHAPIAWDEYLGWSHRVRFQAHAALHEFINERDEASADSPVGDMQDTPRSIRRQF